LIKPGNRKKEEGEWGFTRKKDRICRESLFRGGFKTKEPKRDTRHAGKCVEQALKR